MKQVARNLTAANDGLLLDSGYLLMDRDNKYCEGFRSTLEDAGVHCVRLPPRSPNLNAHIERFMRSIKEECLRRMVFFGETSLRRAICTFLEHYYNERNHQGLENQIIEPAEEIGNELGNIACRERLGGMLRYYYRKVA